MAFEICGSVARSPKEWLFPGTRRAFICRSDRRICVCAREKRADYQAGDFSYLRHSFATHLLEDGGHSVRWTFGAIQELMGHRLETTERYTHDGTGAGANQSPLDRLIWVRRAND